MDLCLFTCASFCHEVAKLPFPKSTCTPVPGPLRETSQVLLVLGLHHTRVTCQILGPESALVTIPPLRPPRATFRISLFSRLSFLSFSCFHGPTFRFSYDQEKTPTLCSFFTQSNLVSPVEQFFHPRLALNLSSHNRNRPIKCV